VAPQRAELRSKTWWQPFSFLHNTSAHPRAGGTQDAPDRRRQVTGRRRAVAAAGGGGTSLPRSVVGAGSAGVPTAACCLAPCPSSWDFWPLTPHLSRMYRIHSRLSPPPPIHPSRRSVAQARRCCPPPERPAPRPQAPAAWRGARGLACTAQPPIRPAARQSKPLGPSGQVRPPPDRGPARLSRRPLPARRALPQPPPPPRRAPARRRPGEEPRQAARPRWARAAARRGRRAPQKRPPLPAACGLAACCSAGRSRATSAGPLQSRRSLSARRGSESAHSSWRTEDAPLQRRRPAAAAAHCGRVQEVAPEACAK